MFTENEIVKLVFGLKVRSLRQEKGLSYQQLSEKTGLALSYLHDIENGKKYPKANKILALAKAFQVEYDYLVSLNANKKLQSEIALLTSDLMNVIPWEHFGISLPTLLSVFANTPDKVTAFIGTLIKIFRNYEMSKENFYTSALRSYQELNDNYFEDLETAAANFIKENHLEEKLPLDTPTCARLLEEKFGIKIDRKKIATLAALNDLRSFYAKEKKLLYLNKYSSAQESFLIARELGFQYLNITDRPYETIMQAPQSFDMVLNNFRASYFAAALLIPEDSIVEDINFIVRQPKWDSKLWLDLMLKYNVTPEMFLQRLTNILPNHFGIEQIFFLRMASNHKKKDFNITKELHLSQPHTPHANAISEHYCRRWIAAKSMETVSQLVHTGKYKHPVIDVQVSQYWQTHNRYLCISISKPKHKNTEDAINVTLGLAVDKQLFQVMPFVNDPSIPTVNVNTTCERCSMENCNERVAPPLYIEHQLKKEKINAALQSLE